MSSSVDKLIINLLKKHEVLTEESLSSILETKQEITSFYEPVTLFDALIFRNNMPVQTARSIISKLKQKPQLNKTHDISAERLLPARFTHPFLSSFQLGHHAQKTLIVSPEKIARGRRAQQRLSEYRIPKTLPEILFEQSHCNLSELKKLHRKIEPDSRQNSLKGPETEESSSDVESFDSLPSPPLTTPGTPAFIWKLIEQDLLSERDIPEIHELYQNVKGQFPPPRKLKEWIENHSSLSGEAATLVQEFLSKSSGQADQRDLDQLVQQIDSSNKEEIQKAIQVCLTHLLLDIAYDLPASVPENEPSNEVSPEGVQDSSRSNVSEQREEEQTEGSQDQTTPGKHENRSTREEVPRTNCKNCEETIRYPERLGGKKGICKYCSHEQPLPPIQQEPDEPDQSMTDTAVMITPAKPASKREGTPGEEEEFLHQCSSCKRVFQINGWLHEKLGICDFCEKIQKLTKQNWSESTRYPRDAKNSNPIPVSSFPNWMSAIQESNSDQEQDKSSFVAVLAPEQPKQEASSTLEMIYIQWQKMVANPRLLWRDLRWSVYFVGFGLLFIGGFIYFKNPSVTRDISLSSETIPTPEETVEQSPGTAEPPQETQDPAPLPELHRSGLIKKSMKTHITRMISLMLVLGENPIHLIFRIPPAQRGKIVLQAYQQAWKNHYHEPLNFQPPRTMFPPAGTTTETPDIWMEIFSKLASDSRLDPYTKLLALNQLEQRLNNARSKILRARILNTGNLPWVPHILSRSIRPSVTHLSAVARSSHHVPSQQAKSILQNHVLHTTNDGENISGSLWFTWLLAEHTPPEKWEQLGLDQNRIKRTLSNLSSRVTFPPRFLKKTTRQFRMNIRSILTVLPRQQKHGRYLAESFTKFFTSERTEILPLISYVMALPGWAEQIRKRHFIPTFKNALKQMDVVKTDEQRGLILAVVHYSLLQNNVRLYRKIRKSIFRKKWVLPEKTRQKLFLQFGDKPLLTPSPTFSSVPSDWLRASFMMRYSELLFPEANDLLGNYLSTESSSSSPGQDTAKNALITRLLHPKKKQPSLSRIAMISLDRENYEISRLAFLGLSEKFARNKKFLWDFIKVSLRRLHQYHQTTTSARSNRQSPSKNPSLQPPEQDQTNEPTKNQQNDHKTMFTLETSSQKRFLHNQIRNALLLREKRSKNAFKTTWTQLEKYKQEHPEQSPSINEIQTLLLQAYKRYFPFRARHASETVQRPDQMPEIATGSTSSSESRKKNGTTWHESLEKVLNVSSRKLFTKEPLTPFLLQPAAAKQIFGGKNDSLPEKLQYVMRKTRNLFHTLLRNNSGKSLDVQIHRITPGNLRTINAGSRFSAGDVTLEAKKEVKIHLNRKWRIRFEDRTITISGHLIRRPKKASSPMKRKWKLLYLHLK